METLELKLTKTRKYSLEPFGRFVIKHNPSEALSKKPHVIPFGRLRFNSEEGFPYTGADEITFVKFMKKHKTDILTDEYRRYFYTRIGDNWVEVSSPKISQYVEYLERSMNGDSEETWKEYIKRY